MLRTKNKLTVLRFNGASFEDYSLEALDYDKDDFTFTFSSDNYLLLGFYKPINTAYVALTTASILGATLSGEYHNGTTWVELKGYHDDSKGLSRDGFLQWERGQEDEDETTIETIPQYWYKFTPSGDFGEVSFKGLNIIFADDNDLKREFFEIDKYLPVGETSHILTHVASRNQIIQKIRNTSEYKSSRSTIKDITAFDLLDVTQANYAATHLTLAKIFGAVFDDPDGLYRAKSDSHMSMFTESMKAPYTIALDKDDDGELDNNEIPQIKMTTVLKR